MIIILYVKKSWLYLTCWGFLTYTTSARNFGTNVVNFGEIYPSILSEIFRQILRIFFHFLRRIFSRGGGCTEQLTDTSSSADTLRLENYFAIVARGVAMILHWGPPKLSAEGARIEAPRGVGIGVSPSPTD